jgi:nucleoside-diphosphate-sugar epimerase
LLEGVGKVLVTGASGFIGRQLVARLLDLGLSVVSVSRSEGSDIVRDRLPLKGVDHVFHLAARTGVSEAWDSPLEFLSINLMGTAKVLEQSRGLCSVTFASAYVYGNPQKIPIPETEPAKVRNPYALSKLLAEQVCEFYARFYGMQVVVLRLFNVYGPGQHNRFLIPFILQQILDPSQPEILVKDLQPSRDYVYISDVVEALLVSTRAPAGSVFNIGSGVSYTVEDIIARASCAAGIFKPYRATGERRTHEIFKTCADVAAIQREVDWKPKVTIDEGLRLTIESMRS